MDGPQTLRRYGGIASLLTSGVGAYIIGKAFSSAPPIGAISPSQADCPAPMITTSELLDYFSSKVNWQAMVALEGVVAVFACILSVSVFVSIALSHRPRLDKVIAGIFGLGLAAVAWDVTQILCMGKDCGSDGLLTRLLGTLPDKCDAVRESVRLGRMLGEPMGIFIGATMAATATFIRIPTLLELSQRHRQLNNLLYAASVLFVAGLLVTRANISWIVAQWDSSLAHALGDSLTNLVATSELVSGVAYSTLLLVFFVPIRWILGYHIERAMPQKQLPNLEARQKWLQENGFSRGWKEDARQVLALLAPVLTVPVFDSLSKL